LFENTFLKIYKQAIAFRFSPDCSGNRFKISYFETLECKAGIAKLKML
jgi:hypothetical protein